MKVVELFAGIGGFRIACDNLKLETVWANDNSIPACSVYKSQFGNEILRIGNIQDHIDGIPNHDLLTAGFPCQPFSSAGKKMGVEDPRGTLFQVIVDILAEKKPDHFVLENVKRLLTMDHGRHFATIIDALASLDYFVEWRLINAMDVGLPQNRQRVFIVGTRLLRDGEEKIRLATTGELLRAGNLNDSILSDVASWPQVVAHGARFPSWGVARNGRFYGVDLEGLLDGEPKILLRNVLQPASEIPGEFDFTDSTIVRIKASTLVQKYIGGVEILSNQGGGARMGYTVFGINGIAPTLTSSQSRHYERYQIGTRYRRLTNIEYARIQGFPDHHCDVISPYNQYALFGNAVPPQMASWVVRHTLSSGEPIKLTRTGFRQPDLFANVG